MTMTQLSNSTQTSGWIPHCPDSKVSMFNLSNALKSYKWIGWTDWILLRKLFVQEHLLKKTKLHVHCPYQNISGFLFVDNLNVVFSVMPFQPLS